MTEGARVAPPPLISFSGNHHLVAVQQPINPSTSSRTATPRGTRSYQRISISTIDIYVQESEGRGRQAAVLAVWERVSCHQRPRGQEGGAAGGPSGIAGRRVFRRCGGHLRSGDTGWRGREGSQHVLHPGSRTDPPGLSFAVSSARYAIAGIIPSSAWLRFRPGWVLPSCLAGGDGGGRAGGEYPHRQQSV